VASCGDLVDDEAFLARAPADAVLCRYAPQLPLLSRVDVVVSHGGANSVVETLRHGLPLLLLPLCNDQHLQARFLDACGAGRVVDPAGIAPADVDASALDDALLRALRALLDDDAPERRRAEEISRSLQAAGGPARVADLVEELGRVRRPLRASDLVGAPQ
jgi:UDP:flavonoid glycosyltransferase YjiC (YdhE family)